MNNAWHEGLVDVAQGLGEPRTLVSFSCVLDVYFLLVILDEYFLLYRDVLVLCFISCTMAMCNYFSLIFMMA